MSPIFEESAFDFVSRSAEQTRRLGARLGALLQCGDVICLAGELGAGKTQMAAGIAAGWGALEPVTSPTFVMVHEHTRAADALRLYHIDCYRMDGVAALWTFGWDDILDQGGPLVIEWPERIEAALPPERLWITLSHIDVEGEENRRHLLFEAEGERHQALLDEFRRRAFGAPPGVVPAD
ncbi:MAG: tRNA (adenosine(37)-N6)-threonylcarbamoyltransferase complex ATPase subunit type 1 TsaE [Anaerolineae bacterium]|nr:tRNA (adenosine(37)-N6)-threonylcarbamoyltransferase complex ATPase subunit type 1 TsaE [Anaerolineae bacterium]